MGRVLSESCFCAISHPFLLSGFNLFSFHGASHCLTVVLRVRCASRVANRIRVSGRSKCQWHSSQEVFCSDVSWSSDDACDVSRNMPLSILLKGAVIFLVASERSLFFCMLRSHSDFAPGVVVLRAVRILRPVPYFFFVVWFQAGAEQLYMYIFH